MNARQTRALKQAQAAVSLIDAAIARPLTVAEALEVLEEIAGDIDARVEGLRDDVKRSET